MERKTDGLIGCRGREVRDNPARRHAFNDLAQLVFELSFEFWWQQGGWGEDYCPYTLFRGNRAVANVSVNRLPMELDGRRRLYLQLGTVMVHPDWRGRGLARRLLERVLADWRGRCDGIYLYANSEVLDFYPRFGFERARESVWSFPAVRCSGTVRKLEVEKAADRALLLEHYLRGNPHARLYCRENPGLLLFYSTQTQQDQLYYLPDFDAVAVAETLGDKLLLHDLFGGSEKATLAELAGVLCGPEIRTVELGFAPVAPAPGIRVESASEEDLTLFVLASKENPFERPLRFPELTHA